MEDNDSPLIDLSITYPIVFQNKLIWVLWKNALCKNGFHLFDEVYSVDVHYLFCDACDLHINIK